MIKQIIPILIASFLVSGCASTMAKTMKNLDQVPRIQEMNHSILKDIRKPDQKPIILAVYGFTDQTGQQKPGGAYAEMSKAVTQGSQHLLIKALLDAGEGKWFRVLERDTLQSLLQERKLIRTTRQIQHGDKAKPIGPMLYAGAYVTGAITGYDTNILTGGIGARYLGIGASAEYRLDVVTICIKLINVTTGEVELTAIVEKSIASAGLHSDIFKYLDTDTKLVEAEAGVATNEPAGYAVRKAIEKGVAEMIEMGEKKGLWGFKPLPIIEQESLEDTDEKGDEQALTIDDLEVRVADYHARVAEAARLVEEARLAEEARIAEEARVVEAARVAEEVRIAEEARAAEEAKLLEEVDVVTLIDMAIHHPAWMYDEETKDNK
jgi:curli production assembly/transport component CsgG